MALQLSRSPQSPYLNAENYAVGQAGPTYAWHIDKNVAEPVAVAMLPVLTGQIAERGLLMLVCDAAIDAPTLKSLAAAAAARAILRNYYYKTEPSNYGHMLFQAMLEGIREANDEIAQRFWSDAEQATHLTLTDNLAGISATAVVAYDNNLVIGTVGNTHAYRIRNGKLAMYEQGEQTQLIVLKDDFRKGDRVFVCTHGLAGAMGAVRIRAAANTRATASPEAMRALIEEAEQINATDVMAAAMLYRNTPAPALLATSRALVPVPTRARVPLASAAPPTSMMRWLTLASALIILAVGAWLLRENRQALPLNPTPAAPTASAAPVAIVPQVPIATGLMPVPVMESNARPAAASLSNTNTLSVVITTSEAGIVVFQVAATETPAPLPKSTSTPIPTSAPTLTLEPSATNTPTPTPQATATATQTRVVVRATVTAKPIATQAPPQPTSPPPQPTSPPPQPTSPPPQPTSPPPQPTSPPPQPTSPPPQPTSPPPQPTPDLVVPCLPGDTQCKP